MGVNRVILIGNVGKDPEVKNINENLKVATFPMATTEKYKNKEGQMITNTEWHDIVVWRGLAGVAEKYIKKGSPVYIEGKIRTRTWDDKDGNKKYRTEIIAENLQMLGTKQTAKPEATPPDNEVEHIPSEESDLPF